MKNVTRRETEKRKEIKSAVLVISLSHIWKLGVKTVMIMIMIMMIILQLLATIAQSVD
jgi:hypothetical protein